MKKILSLIISFALGFICAYVILQKQETKQTVQKPSIVVQNGPAVMPSVPSNSKSKKLSEQQKEQLKELDVMATAISYSLDRMNLRNGRIPQIRTNRIENLGLDINVPLPSNTKFSYNGQGFHLRVNLDRENAVILHRMKDTDGFTKMCSFLGPLSGIQKEACQLICMSLDSYTPRPAEAITFSAEKTAAGGIHFCRY